MASGPRLWSSCVAVLILAISCADAQHVIQYPMGMGLGYSLFGFGNPPVALCEDTAVVISDGLQPGALVTGGLLAVHGLSSGRHTFQYLGFEGAIDPFAVMTRRVFRLDDTTALYLGTAEWDGFNGHLVVFKDVRPGVPGQVVVHDQLPHDIWAKGWAQLQPLGPGVVLIPATGPDTLLGTADDELLLCTGVGTSEFEMTAYNPGSGLSSTVLALTDSVGISVANGFDNIRGTNDDVLLVITNTNGTLGVTSHILGLPLGSWLDTNRGLKISDSVVVFPTSQGVGSPLTGTNASFTVVQGLPANPTGVSVTSVPTGSMWAWGAPQPVRLDDQTMVHLSTGIDLQPGTSDDAVVVVRNLDGTPTVDTYAAGVALGSTVWSRKPLLVQERMIVPSNGPDGFFATADDGLMAVSKLGGGNPQFDLITLGNAAVAVGRIHESGVWAVMLYEAPVYVSGLQSLYPSINPLPELAAGASQPIHVNDWTFFGTAPGSSGTTSFNDAIKVLHFPYVEHIGSGSSGQLGMVPQLVTSTFPAIASGWYPIDLHGGRPGSLTGLIFSRSKGEFPISQNAMLFLDPTELVCAMDNVTDAMGGSTFLLQMPGNMSLAGRAYACQAYVLDSDASDGFTVTNGLVLHL